MNQSLKRFSKKIVKPKIDVAFKRLFSSGDLSFLKSLLASILGVEQSKIVNLRLTKSEIPPKYPCGKFSRLDVNAEVNGKKVNVEMQCLHFDDFSNRSLFYWADLYLEDLEKGQEYSELQPTICINIVDKKMFDKPDFHSVFRLMDDQTHHVLTSHIELHFLELPKVGRVNESVADEELLVLWMQFLNAETEADLDMLMKSGVAEISNAAATIKEMSADEKIYNVPYKVDTTSRRDCLKC